MSKRAAGGDLPPRKSDEDDGGGGGENGGENGEDGDPRDLLDESSSASSQDRDGRGDPHPNYGGGGGGGSRSSGSVRGGLFSSPKAAEGKFAEGGSVATGSTCSMSITTSPGYAPSSPGGASFGGASFSGGLGSLAVLAESSASTPGGGLGQRPVGGRGRSGADSRRRRRSRRRSGGASQSPAALLRQMRALSAAISASFLFFLVFYLSLPAFFFLLLTTSLTGVASAVGYRYASIRYEEIMASGGFLQLLPQSARRFILNALTGQTLHDFLTDPALFMEYRYLLLYSVPGLGADQIGQLVDRLPERHRRVLRQRGFLRNIVPEGVQRLLIADGTSISAEPSAAAPAVPLLGGPGSGPGASSADGGSGDGIDASMAEVWGGIAATVTSVLRASSHPMSQRVLEVIEEEESDGVTASDRSVVDDDEASGGTTGESDASSDDRQGGLVPPTVVALRALAQPDPEDLNLSTSTDFPLGPEPSTVGQERSQDIPVASPPSPEEEQRVEGDILNEAFSQMAQNYANTASDAANNTIANAIEYVTPTIIRLGAGTTALSGLGLLGSYYFNWAQHHGWTRPRLGNGGSGNGGPSSRPGAAAVTYGLLGTAFLGSASAGMMYLARRHVRSAMLAGRDKSGVKDGNAKGGGIE